MSYVEEVNRFYKCDWCGLLNNVDTCQGWYIIRTASGELHVCFVHADHVLRVFQLLGINCYIRHPAIDGEPLGLIDCRGEE
jgi:hypothetical protein